MTLKIHATSSAKRRVGGPGLQRLQAHPCRPGALTRHAASRTFAPKSDCPAFTVFEVLVVIAVLGILCLVLLPPLALARSKANSIQCNNNLKQVGLAFRIWAGDHQDRNPTQVSTNEGGTKELVNTTNMFRHFQVLSNELNTPVVLICPGDKERRPATNFFGDFNNRHAGYFVGVDAGQTNYAMFLSGDRNLTNGLPLSGGAIMLLTTNARTGWTKAMHGEIGNVGLADGSVQQLSSSRLRDAMATTGADTNRLAFP